MKGRVHLCSRPAQDWKVQAERLAKHQLVLSWVLGLESRTQDQDASMTRVPLKDVMACHGFSLPVLGSL